DSASRANGPTRSPTTGNTCFVMIRPPCRPLVRLRAALHSHTLDEAGHAARSASHDLRSFRRPGLADGLVEPHLVAERVHDLEGLVAPPLSGQRVGDPHALLLELFVVGR